MYFEPAILKILRLLDKSRMGGRLPEPGQVGWAAEAWMNRLSSSERGEMMVALLLQEIERKISIVRYMFYLSGWWAKRYAWVADRQHLQPLNYKRVWNMYCEYKQVLHTILYHDIYFLLISNAIHVDLGKVFAEQIRRFGLPEDIEMVQQPKN